MGTGNRFVGLPPSPEERGAGKEVKGAEGRASQASQVFRYHSSLLGGWLIDNDGTPCRWILTVHDVCERLPSGRAESLSRISTDIKNIASVKRISSERTRN
ncbi:uncharacterized protein LOC112460565 [Temnothorax curvispinosus]|uniref:Uncharacterized protein LOC112460565 n=1 Tax=Temnothorax curvispinosus TaxID=300111 RepID=A0A6J1QGX8_9HYME|nr:uncharacterized protein LOC112460565 [Temnothorax curvispinosus]